MKQLIEKHNEQFNKIMLLRKEIFVKAGLTEEYIEDINKIEFIDNKWFLGINKLRYKYDYTIALDNDATITLYFIQANKEYSIFIDWFSKTLFILDNNKRSKKVFL